jgi:hypothetical protein
MALCSMFAAFLVNALFAFATSAPTKPGAMRSAVSLFDPFQELLIILLLDPIALLGALTEPPNILGNLLHQLDHIGFVFWHRSIT